VSKVVKIDDKSSCCGYISNFRMVESNISCVYATIFALLVGNVVDDMFVIT
jgi:hypothetical protein